MPISISFSSNKIGTGIAVFLLTWLFMMLVFKMQEKRKLWKHTKCAVVFILRFAWRTFKHAGFFFSIHVCLCLHVQRARTHSIAKHHLHSIKEKCWKWNRHTENMSGNDIGTQYQAFNDAIKDWWTIYIFIVCSHQICNNQFPTLSSSWITHIQYEIFGF